MSTIKRPAPEIIEALSELGTDAVTSTMEALGVRRTFMEGPIARVPGSKIVGPALTLRFTPQREDQMRGYQIPEASAEESEPEGEEAGEKTSALWEVMFEVQAGDVIVVDGRGDLATGCFGEMLMTYFQAQGGAGVVIDAGIRDSVPIFQELKVPVWSTAVTTGGAGHLNLFPADFQPPYRLRQGLGQSRRHYHGGRWWCYRRAASADTAYSRHRWRARGARGLCPY